MKAFESALAHRQSRLVAALAVFATVAVGCRQQEQGPQFYPVAGIVTYQGRPVTYGHVTFVGDHGPPSPPAVLKEDGSFTTRATAGTHKVVVHAIPPPRGGKPEPLAEGGIDYSQAEPAKSLVPLKYARPETSDVTVEVSAAAENRLDIVLH